PGLLGRPLCGLAARVESTRSTARRLWRELHRQWPDGSRCLHRRYLAGWAGCVGASIATAAALLEVGAAVADQEPGFASAADGADGLVSARSATRHCCRRYDAGTARAAVPRVVGRP